MRLFLGSIERKDVEITGRRIRGRIVGADNNFFLPVAIDIANHRRRGQTRRKILWPARAIHELHAIPVSERNRRTNA